MTEPERIELLAKCLWENDPQKQWPISWGWDAIPAARKVRYEAMAKGVIELARTA